MRNIARSRIGELQDCCELVGLRAGLNDRLVHHLAIGDVCSTRSDLLNELFFCRWSAFLYSHLPRTSRIRQSLGRSPWDKASTTSLLLESVVVELQRAAVLGNRSHKFW